MDMELYEFARRLFNPNEPLISRELPQNNNIDICSGNITDKMDDEAVSNRKRETKICLATCFLLNDEMCDVLDSFNEELLRNNCHLIVLSSFTPKKQVNFQIIIIPYSLYEYGKRYQFHDEFKEIQVDESEQIVERDIAFSGAKAGSYEDHRMGLIVCHRYFSLVVSILKPSVVLIWGSTLPQSTVLKRVCERHEVSSYILERGLLADTVMIEKRGNGAESELNQQQTWWKRWRTSDDVSILLKAREYYLARKPQKYCQAGYHESLSILDDPGLKNKNILAFWGQHDVWSGLVPRDSSLSFLNSPFFESTSDALEHLIESVRKISNAVLIFKPHPRDTSDYSHYQSDGVIVIRDIDNHALFQKADCVAAMLTTTQFEALLYEKPIILLAASQIKGKGIAYEYSADCDLANIIDAALTRKDFEEKRENMKRFLAGILSDFLYGCNSDVPTRKRLADLALMLSLNGAKNNEISSVNERILMLCNQLDQFYRQCDHDSYHEENKNSELVSVEQSIKKQDHCFTAGSSGGVKQNSALSVPESCLPAFDRFFKLLRKENISHPVSMQAGILCYRLSLYDESKYYFKNILTSDPDDIDALNNLGAVCFQLKEYNIAYDLLKRSIELAPHNQEARQNLLALQKRMQEEWDERAAEDAHYYIHSSKREQTEEEFDSSGRKNVQALIIEDMKIISSANDPKSMTVLEIGCGIGRMTRHMADIFGEVHGIDVSGEMIRWGRERLKSCPNVVLHKGNGKDLSLFNDMNFDFVFSFIVFQHIPFKEVIFNYIREANRVLKPNGIFKFQVHGEVSQNYLKSPKNTWHGEPVTEDDIRNISEEVGFAILSMDGQGTQYSWYTLKKIINRKDLSDRGKDNGQTTREARFGPGKTGSGIEKILDEIAQEFERCTPHKELRL